MHLQQSELKGSLTIFVGLLLSLIVMSSLPLFSILILPPCDFMFLFEEDIIFTVGPDGDCVVVDVRYPH